METKIFVASFKEHGHLFIPMLHKHYDEIGLAGVSNLNFAPDLQAYRMLDALHKAVFIGAMLGNDPVGYMSAYTVDHTHYKGTRFGVIDAVYVEPEHRKSRIARDMFKKLETELVEKYDVSYVQFVFSINHDLSNLAEVLGYRPSEKVYIKNIRE